MKTTEPQKANDTTGPGWTGSAPRRRPRPRRRVARRRENVGRTERVASLIAGGVLGMLSMRGRGRFRLMLSVAAGELVYRGLTGHCHVYSALRIDRGDPRDRLRGRQQAPVVTPS